MEECIVFCYLLDRLVEEKVIDPSISKRVKSLIWTRENSDNEKAA